MADPRFKVKRQAYFKRGITTASTLNVTGAVNFDSTLTVDGATTQTGAWTLNSGTTISKILAGSGALVFGSVATSVASVTCFAVTGLTQAYKLAVTGSGLSGCVTVACAYCTAAGGELVVGIINQSTEAVSGTSQVHYVAFLDQ